jgi:diacylglycerol kinase
MVRLAKSFRYAALGLKYCIQKEKNFQLHCIAAGIAIILGIAFNLSGMEWIIIIICIALVLALEMFNTAIEHLCNVVQPDVHPLVKVIKDVSAGAVLLMAIMAAICGAIIFLPKLFLIFYNF